MAISHCAIGAQAEGEAAAATAGGDESANLFNEGLTRFAEGNFDEAVKTFEKAFALNPTNDQIARFMDSANAVRFLQMVRSDNPKIAGIGQTLLTMRRAVRRTKLSDQEGIRAVADKVLGTNDESERLVAMLDSALKYGRNLVPVLIPSLGSPESSVRTLAFTWITKVELDAIPPLVAAARHPNPLVRQNVAMLLGTRPIRHPFSLATLKGLVEEDKVAEVRDAAQQSLDAVQRDAKAKKLAAKDYHLFNASLLYLRPHLNPFAKPEYAPTIYSLNGEEVVAEAVAPFQISPRMAEAELVEALRIAPSFTDAKVQRLENEALQIVQYDDAVGFYAKAPAGESAEGKGGAEVKDLLEKQKPMMDLVRRLRLRAQPKEIVYAALESALESRKPEVAEKLIGVIRENRFRGTVPPALVEALKDRSSRLVRIAAAAAISEWDPEDSQGFGKAAVSTLAEAAVLSGVRIVHKVMGNADNATRFDSIFRDLNIDSGANLPDVVEGIERAVDLPPDIVLVDEEARPVPGGRERAPVNAIVRELRKAYRTTGTPIVVAVDPRKIAEKKALYESEEKKVLVVPADCTKASFKSVVLDRLFTGSEDQTARATALAARAAEALAAASARPSHLPLESAVKPLLEVLQNRPDEVRVPAITTLGNLRTAATVALKPLAGLYSNAENAVAVREAAMLAVGRILAASGEKAPPEVLRAVLSGMAEADPKLREPSYIAFGAAGATDEEQLRALTFEASVPAPAAKEGAPEAKPAEGEEKAGEKAEKAEKDEKPEEAEKAEKPEKAEDEKKAEGEESK
jgi:tetratricopeptide (TPR) repeat protein